MYRDEPSTGRAVHIGFKVTIRIIRFHAVYVISQSGRMKTLNGLEFELCRFFVAVVVLD